MKIKGADGEETPETDQLDGEKTADDEPGQSVPAAAGASATSQQDMQRKMSRGIDPLDALLTKTENAQYAMAHQSKQMKSFLK